MPSRCSNACCQSKRREARLTFAWPSDFARRRPEAQKRLDELLKREPNNAQAMVLQGEFLLAEGKYDDAINRLQSAIAANSSSTEASSRSDGRMRRRTTGNRRSKPSTRRCGLTLALCQPSWSCPGSSCSGSVDSSVQLAEQALKNAPGNADARLALVRSLTARRDVREPRASCRP